MKINFVCYEITSVSLVLCNDIRFCVRGEEFTFCSGKAFLKVSQFEKVFNDTGKDFTIDLNHLSFCFSEIHFLKWMIQRAPYASRVRFDIFVYTLIYKYKRRA